MVSRILKKTCDFHELAPEPEIQSCDSGQQIPYSDSCQMTIIWMSIIKLNTGYRLPNWHFTLVSLWCGRMGIWSHDYQNFSDG